MTKEEFVRNNRGIDDGADLPVETLTAIYDRITASGFKVSGQTCGQTFRWSNTLVKYIQVTHNGQRLRCEWRGQGYWSNVLVTCRRQR